MRTAFVAAIVLFAAAPGMAEELGSALGALVSLSHLRHTGGGAGVIALGADGRSPVYGGVF